MKNRRVGMFTFGAMLVIAGTSFFIGSMFSYVVLFNILKYWPLILVMLGVEVLVAYYSKRDDIKYDFWSFVLIFMTLCTLLGAAAVDYAVRERDTLEKNWNIEVPMP